MIFKRALVWAAVVCGPAAMAIGADAAPPAQAGFSLTIYSNADPASFDPQDYVRQQTLNSYYAQQNPLPGYGVVRENREIQLNQGENIVKFTDVAAEIDPTTVSFQSLTSPAAASVLEQNYEYDLVSADKLLDKYLGKEIQVVRRGAGQTGRRKRWRERCYRSTDPISCSRIRTARFESLPAGRRLKTSNWPSRMKD